MSIPQAVLDLLNKTEAGFHAVSYAAVKRSLRVVRSEDWRTFRVERLRMHNKDPLNPRGAWQTIATLTNERPGFMMPQAMERLHIEQRNLIARSKRRAEARRPKLLVPR